MSEQLSLPQVDALETETAEVPSDASEPARITAKSSLRTAIAGFEVYMEQRDFAENTIKAFLSDLDILIEFMGVGTALEAISTRDLNRFTHWLVHDRGAPCSPKSLARRVTTLKVFFGWLAETKVLSSDPSDPVVHKPVATSLPDVLSAAEVERLLAVTQSLRHGEKPDARPHVLVTLLLHTGIKKGEAMRLVMNHFDFGDPAQPVVWIRYANPRRRHKERKLRLPVWWPTVLAEYRSQYEVENALFSCTARNLEYVLSGVAEQADIAKGMSFEMLRWTCAVRDHKAGMEGDRLRQKMGVSKITWREMKVKLAALAAPAL